MMPVQSMYGGVQACTGFWKKV